MNKSHGKSRPSAKNPTAATPVKGRRASEIASLREKLKRAEQQRDYYARELARRVAKEFDPGEVNEDEWTDIIKNGSGVSLEDLAREIAKDAEH